MWKFILLINFAVFCLWSAAEAQTTNKNAQTNEWKEAKIEKHGVQTISIPQNLTKESENDETRQNDEMSWIDYYKNYRNPPENSIQNSMEVDIINKIWNSDLAKLTERQPGLDMPEKVMDFELSVNSKNITPNEIGINSMNYYQVDGTKGILTKSTLRENRIRVIWHVFRYYENKPQSIDISVSCPQADLPKAIKIVDSIKLEKKNGETLKVGKSEPILKSISRSAVGEVIL